MSTPDLVEEFAERFENELRASQTGDSATDEWATLHDTKHRTALATYGRKTSKSHDCGFSAKSADMTSVIEAKRAALAEYKRSPSERNLQILLAAGAKLSRPPDAAPTSTGQSSAKPSSQQQLQGTSEGCTMASRRQWDQCTTRRPPSNPPLRTKGPRHSTLSAEMASSKSCQRLAAHPSCRA